MVYLILVLFFLDMNNGTHRKAEKKTGEMISLLSVLFIVTMAGGTHEAICIMNGVCKFKFLCDHNRPDQPMTSPIRQLRSICETMRPTDASRNNSREYNPIFVSDPLGDMG